MMAAGQGREDPAAGNFGAWANPWLAFGLLGLWFGLVFLFMAFPQADIAATALFFSPTACADGVQAATCGDFPAASNVLLALVRRVFHILPVAAAVCLFAWVIRAATTDRGRRDPRTRLAAATLATLVIGPGLLVNGFLKSEWGRPRPLTTDLFGGDLPFVAAGQWSDACARNCSFVSGEASAIAWLLVLVPLLPPTMRLPGAVVAAIVAVFVSGLRIAFGAHYLSDVVLGGLSTLVVFAAITSIASSRRRAPAPA